MISSKGKTTLERLSACDKYIWRGEQLVMWRFVVCVILPVLLSVGRIWLVGSLFYCNVLILYCAAASIAWVLFEARISQSRWLGARMMQLAECDLYGIRWNKYLCGEEPLPEDVSLNLRLDLGKYEGHFPETENMDEGFVKNIKNIYDGFKTNIRKHLKFCQWVAGVAILLIVVSSALIYEINFNGFLFYAVLPCVPIVIWLQAIMVNYKRCNAQLGLATAVDAMEMNESNKAMIQDCVFMYRENACLVPRVLFAHKD